MRSLFSLLVAPFMLAACAPPGPTPIRYGEAACAHCHMTASDPRFGTELVTTTGKTYVFDAAECLAAYLRAHPETAEQTHSLWVTAFDAPGVLIPLEDAFFVRAPAISSPMGMHLAAFAKATPEREVLDAFPDAEMLTWDGVLALTDTAAHP